MSTNSLLLCTILSFSYLIIIISGACTNISFHNARIKLYKIRAGENVTVTVNGCLNSTLAPHEYQRIECINQGVQILHKNAISEIIVSELVLNDNEMREIEEEAFNEIDGLRLLDLSNNELTVLKKNALHNLYGLDKLILRNNKLSAIEPGTFRNLQMKELNLENNQLVKYSPDWFRNNGQLKILNLAKNKIEELPSGAFRRLENIDNINLKGNLLAVIDPEAFTAVHKLSTLDLSENRLKTLHKDTFRSFNGIAAENPDARPFAEMPSMHISFFKAFTGIQSLYLHSNNLTFLPEKLLKDVSNNMNYINIHSNPWQCACYLKILHWAENSERRIGLNVFNIGCVYYHNPVCAMPSQDPDKCVEEEKVELYDIYNSNYDYGYQKYSTATDVRCF